MVKYIEVLLSSQDGKPLIGRFSFFSKSVMASGISLSVHSFPCASLGKCLSGKDRWFSFTRVLSAHIPPDEMVYCGLLEYYSVPMLLAPCNSCCLDICGVQVLCSI